MVAQQVLVLFDQVRVLVGQQGMVSENTIPFVCKALVYNYIHKLAIMPAERIPLQTTVCSSLREAYKETKKVKNTKPLSEEVKDKLRPGSGDKFSFKDISNIYLRCFRIEYPSAQEIATTILG